MREKDKSERPQNRADATLCGRSMMEMLGVLAIIGVLSVGAISGYSKAMFKHKLNKQTEQINTIISALYRYQFDLRLAPETTSMKTVDLIPILKKLNEIPLEMYIEGNTTYIRDAFGTECYAYHRTNNGVGEITYRCDLERTEYGFETCRNLYTIAKEWHQELYSITTVNYKGTSYGTKARYYGDSGCTEGQKCLKDLTLDKVPNVCQVEKGDSQYGISIMVARYTY